MLKMRVLIRIQERKLFSHMINVTTHFIGFWKTFYLNKDSLDPIEKYVSQGISKHLQIFSLVLLLIWKEIYKNDIFKYI
jgi:hypothetical protein